MEERRKDRGAPGIRGENPRNEKETDLGKYCILKVGGKKNKGGKVAGPVHFHSC